jgi:hypothetical protein
MRDWTFLSNYGHVLVCLARNRDVRLRDVAEEVGITERAVQKIVRDLQSADFVVVSKHGRCNRYRINKRKTLRHELEAHCTVGKLLALVAHSARAGQREEPAEAVDEVSTPVHREPAAPRQLADTSTPEKQPSEAKPAPAGKKSGRKKPAPGNARQQGSLF